MNSSPLSPIWLLQPIPYFGEKLKKEDWIVEPKIDGWRLQVLRRPDGEVEFWGRRLKKAPDWTAKLPGPAAIAKKLIPPGTLLDAELYAEGGRRFIPTALSGKKNVQPIIYIFDLVYHGGSFMGDHSLEERKAILKTLPWEEPFRLIEGRPFTDLEEELNRAIADGGEGIVIKKLNSKYLVGRDCPEASEFWRKIKGR